MNQLLDFSEHPGSYVEFRDRQMPIKKHKLPGRNDPCVCGSGKKFKKCCLHKFEDGTYETHREL